MYRGIGPLDYRFDRFRFLMDMRLGRAPTLGCSAVSEQTRGDASKLVVEPDHD
jgi:hypothetical protein